jgi:FkbM family methyltransferase
MYKYITDKQSNVMIVQITNKHNRVYNVQQHSVVDRAFAAGIYQVTSLRYLRQLVPQARRIVDVGANVGTNTIEYATWAQSVEAFECNNDTYALLLANIAANKQRTGGKPWYPYSALDMSATITTHNTALMDQCATAFVTHREAGLADFVRYDTGDQPCTTTTIDSYNWQDVDIIKADTEGTEWLVMQGAKKTIEQCRPVVQVEFWNWEKRFGLNNQHMLDYFQSIGYVQTNNTGDIIAWDAHGRWNKKLAKTAGHKNSAMDRFFVPQELTKGNT